MSLVLSGSSPEISPELLARFLALIGVRTGLHIRDKDRSDVQRVLADRIKVLRLVRPESYLHLLEAQSSLHNGEWIHLLPRLTNGESYFWRDKGQFSLLRTRILPELIEARTSSRTLRIWSAGCSTGEEPYSLAMLVDELLPRREEWNILILGTDLNHESLDKARAGLYGAWAFRGLDISVQERYFERTKTRDGLGFQISSKLRGMVSFSLCNLRGDEFPSRLSGIHDMDLILCRNVLIYFGREAIAHTLSGFTRTLRPGGYLLTGHAELASQDPAPLKLRTFAESVAYQACETPAKEPAQQPFITVGASAAIAGGTRPSFERNANRAPIAIPVSPPPGIPKRQLPGIAIANLGAPVASQPPAGAPTGAPIDASEAATELCQRARASADLGKYEVASRLCAEAIALDSTCSAAYFIWGQVEIEQGQSEKAKNLFKKVIYLAPLRFDAHLEIAAIYDAENDAARARRERQAALELLRALPDDELLASHPGVRASEMRHHLEEQLETAPHRANGPRGAR